MIRVEITCQCGPHSGVVSVQVTYVTPYRSSRDREMVVLLLKWSYHRGDLQVVFYCTLCMSTYTANCVHLQGAPMYTYLYY